jgi:glutamate dehydrogenase/leucine dehydrogenase
MWKRYNAFLRQPPALSLSWHDAGTGARAWLVINSLRGNAAGGGTRMRPGVDAREVTYLAKTMELKFAVAGPPIGGAKGGIDFDPADPRKGEVLERWYRAILPYLREHYGTGGDLGVDEVRDVIPCIARLGLAHPQQGIVRGHLRPDALRFQRVLQALDTGVRAPLAESEAVSGCSLTIADAATGFGLARAIQRLYERQGRDLSQARVLMEGFGNVGASCSLFLARTGARLVGIADAEQALLDPDGLDADDVAQLIRRRSNGMLPADDPRILRGAPRSDFWQQPADVFVTAALSQTLTRPVLEQLRHNGVHVLASGANQPFREVRIGSTRLQQWADRRFSVIPDIVANCGMARTFSYLMEDQAEVTCHAMLRGIEHTIDDALDEVLDRTDNRPTTLLDATLDLALDRIGAA